MKKITFLLLVLAGIGANLIGQTTSKFDLRLGAGRSLLGTGDMRTLMLENELNYHFNRVLAVSGSVGYARSNSGVFEHAALVQVNANVFVSPFKTEEEADFRIGGGLTFHRASSIYLNERNLFDGATGVLLNPPPSYTYLEEKSFGWSAIIEYTYAISDRILLGGKVFTQPYFNGDINSGFLAKVGVRL